MGAKNLVGTLLRAGVIGIFAGHGWYALTLRPQWFAYLHTVGIVSPYDAYTMRAIGCMDLLIALLTVIKPIKEILLWAAFWAFATAVIRPISGENWLEFVERAGNWACPLALYFIIKNKL